MTAFSIYNKLETLPDNLKQEVSDFVDFLLEKSAAKHTEQKKAVPKPGSAKGKIRMSPDFDEPLDEFKDYI
ncbi:MAG: hypothetical protein K0Q79_1313 [Flavipsychrobacter sp.]|jgi:hypothetical protein|nr:hypothetical protein [Flavipsychrobacter sp.]